MKKFTLLLISFFLISVVASAQNTLNNPKDSTGYYIVKWNCGEAAFASSNDFEADETFTFAVDVTGTAWESWLKETPTAAGATRALAINKWTNYGNVSGGTNRLKQVKENVYAATWNLVQMGTDLDVVKATSTDSVLYIYGQVFGFEYIPGENPGAGWWMWPSEVPGGTQIDPGVGNSAIFATKPYTGSKTSAELWSDDYDGGLFFSNNTPERGYTLPCMIATGLYDLEVITPGSSVIGHEYYSVQGQRLPREPQYGLYIHRKLKADGSSESIKIFKNIK